MYAFNLRRQGLFKKCVYLEVQEYTKIKGLMLSQSDKWRKYATIDSHSDPSSHTFAKPKSTIHQQMFQSDKQDK